jgi:cell division protein FtsB
MARRSAPPDDVDDGAESTEPAVVVEESPGGRRQADLSELPVLGLTRRRVGWAIGVVVATWIVIVFARQVGEASAATAQADALRASNDALAAQITALEHERTLIQRQAYIEQQARAFGMGGPREVPFGLAPNTPSLPPDAPGSAATSLGAVHVSRSPLESWLELLFGPAG